MCVASFHNSEVIGHLKFIFFIFHEIVYISWNMNSVVMKPRSFLDPFQEQ